MSEYLLGIDIGSTTVKVALVDPVSEETVYSRYVRHGAQQRETTLKLVQEMASAMPGVKARACFTGSGGREIAHALSLGHVQEVVANSLAVRRFHPETRVAIELGGQDAKVIFFHADPVTGELNASDMRMNGSCAGGTGAFIDEVAKLLQVPVEGFDELAARGTRVYQISGRCGVFAKTDIQPLLNQGVDRGDLALSTFHAVARQTIGGLAQGLQITPPVIFQGGPLTFDPTLVRVFAERLGLSAQQQIRPAQPEVFVAHGAALSLPVIFPDTAVLTLEELVTRLTRLISDENAARLASRNDGTVKPFFETPADRQAFDERHRRVPFERASFAPGARIGVYIGIDAGSTTTKVALLDEDGVLLDSAYSHNEGAPLRTGARIVGELLERYRAEGVEVIIRGVGTTGYGEKLFATAFRADYHTVETVAHAHAALREAPEAGFVLDIGGQDMKAITIADRIVTGIALNEACSAGCGSFLENFASTLNIPVTEIAEKAFASTNPSQLGSRCTVFMNSSIITEQKNGKGPEDILAGVCRSIIENVFTKVVRVPNFHSLGDVVVVQGGTFENDAVLRALEQYTGRTVVRASYPGLMGAIGVALLTQEHQLARRASRTQILQATRRTASVEALSGAADHLLHAESGPISRFRGLADLDGFDFEQESGVVCPFCANACSRTVVRFAGGQTFVTGNRCERGEILQPPTDDDGRRRLREIAARRNHVPNLMREREKIVMRASDVEVIRPLPEGERLRIGIPRVLEFWHSLPFWRAFWTTLGYEVGALWGEHARAL